MAARLIDRLDVREVPLRMGFNTGIPGAPVSERVPSDLAPARAQNAKRRNVKSPVSAISTVLHREALTTVLAGNGFAPGAAIV
jgi:hypothetical protein